MTSSGGNIQLTSSSTPNTQTTQTTTSSASTPISLVNAKSIILNQSSSNHHHRLAIPIVLTNPIGDSSTSSKKINQTPTSKVTLQSFKNTINDKSTTSSTSQSPHLTNATVAVKAATANFFSLILSNSQTQQKPVVTTLNNATLSPKIVVSNNVTPKTTSTTIAQLCAISNQKQQQTNSTPQQLISQILPQSMRLVNTSQNVTIPTSLLVNSTSNSNSNSSCNSTSCANQSPSSSPLKPNIIRKARRDSPSSHGNISLLQNSNNNATDHIYNLTNQQNQSLMKHPVFELNVDSLKALSQIPIPTALLPSAQNLINLTETTQTSQQQQQQPAQYLSIPSSSLVSSSSTSASPSSSTTSTQSIPKSICNVINEALIESSNTPSTSKSQTIRKMTLLTTSRPESPVQQPTTSSQPSESSSTPSNDPTTQQTTRKRRKQEFKKQNLDTLINPNPLTVGLNDQKKLKNSDYFEDLQEDDTLIHEPAVKIPRFQNQLIKTDKKRLHSSIKIKDHESDESLLDDDTVEMLSKDFSFVDRQGIRWTTKRQRSQHSIAKSYKPTWKPKQNHFVKYSDVTLYQTTSPLLSSQSTNQSKNLTKRELVDNLNEWKFHYVISQVNNLIEYENESLEVMSDVESFLKNRNFLGFSDICFKISESIKANSQRHKYINEQLDETQLLIHKLFEHKEKYKNYLIITSSGTNGTTSSTTTTTTSQTSPQTTTCTKKSIHSKQKINHQFKNITTTRSIKIKETKIKTK